MFNDYNLFKNSMKQLIRSFTLCAFLLICSVNMKAQVSFGSSEKFNDGWQFVLSAKEPDSKAQWRKVTLPHDWSIEATPSRELASCTGYLPGGIGWYKKAFTVVDTHECHFIYFEGVYNRSEVFLNGHLLGKRPNGYISFMYDMTPYLKKGENVLTVKVDHSRYADSRWYTGSGIYRNVWLIHSGRTHFKQWGVSYTTEVIGDEAVIHVNADIENPQNKQLTIQASLDYAPDSKKLLNKFSCPISELASHSLVVKKPKLWDIDSPNLYKLRVQLLDGNNIIDTTSINIGIRTLEFNPDHGFKLNGKSMKVKGVCMHHDAGVLGAAVPREVWHRRLLKVKELGANAIRMSHNPQAPDVYDLCDELGLLVMDEASDEWEYPKRKWVKGWNKGKPSYDGTFDFFEEWIDRDVADMVRRDRNHPSVFLWSIGNEVDYPNDPYSHPILDGDGATINQPMFGGYKPDAPNAERIGKIAKRLSAIVRSIDTSRPVTGALAGVVMSNQTEYPEAVDVVGYNYTEDRYTTDHKLYPKRIIFGSETHADMKAWNAVNDNEHIFGHFVWTGFDYLGESGEWPSRGLGTGLIDFTGTLKPNGKFYQAIWKGDTTMMRSQWRGNRRQGQMPRTTKSPVAIKAYTDFEGKEFIQLIIELIDDEGNKVMTAKNEVTVNVISGGKFFGLETGNNSDMSDPRANHRHASQGMLLAYIQRGNTSEPVRISIEAEGVQPVEVSF